MRKGNDRVIDNHDPSSVTLCSPCTFGGCFLAAEKIYKLILVGNNNKKDQVRAETDRECRQRDKYVQEMNRSTFSEHRTVSTDISTINRERIKEP